MLGEDCDDDSDTNRNELYLEKSKSNFTTNSQNYYLDISGSKSKEGKKERSKKRKKKSCENCKALAQKISELDQLNDY